MKNLLFSVLLYIATTVTAQVSHVFTTQVADYQISAKEAYKLVTTTQTDNFTTQAGAPQLPVFSKNFVLPSGSTVTNISISNQSEILLASNILLYPTQPPRTWASEPEFVPHDPAVYNSSTAYPAATVVQTADGSTQGYHIVTLDICPFRYIPSQERLYLYQTVNITIQYTLGNIEQTEKITQFRYNLNKEWVAAQVTNPELLNTIEPTAKTVLDETVETDKMVLHWKPSVYGDFPDYIIITNEALKSNFQDLADYKTKRGFPTLVVTTEQIYPNYPGVDNAEKIRDYLRAAYKYWGAGLFVLLGGDTPVIPARIGDYHYSDNPTDLYYSDVYKYNPDTDDNDNYNWNSDGDANFGEDNDGLETTLGADNYIGRAPVNTPQEALNFKNKIMNYEKLNGIPPNQRNYVSNMLFLGAYTEYNSENYNYPRGQLWHYDLADEPFLLDSSLKKWRVYDDHLGVTATYGGQQVTVYGDEELDRVTALNRMSNGAQGIGKFHLISQYDHGGPFAMGVSGSYHQSTLYREDMDALGNGNYLQIMYIPACESGRFTLDSFSEHYINKQNSGGIALISNTATVPISSEGVKRVKKLFQSIYDDIDGLSNAYLMGIAFQNARNENTNPNNKQYKKVLTLFGDPTMMTWSATPGNINITAPPFISINNASENTLNVGIGNLDYDATVTLYKFNTTTGYPEIFTSKKVPAHTTSTQFNLNPDTPGTLLITATARNYMPATKNVTIQMPQPHLYVTGFTFSDSNGNNHIEPGENITLNVNLKNSGGVSVSSITTLLSCPSGLATVTNAIVNHAQSVNAGQTITLSGFTFTPLIEMGVDEIPDFIEFHLNINASNNYNHLDNFYLDMYSPALELGARTMTRNENIVDPQNIPNNEEIDLKINVHNIGNIETGALTALLSTNLDNHIIEITTPNGNYPNIDIQSEETNTLPFKFKLLAPSANIPFTLTLTNALGKSWTFDFDMEEAFPPKITGFNFTSDPDEINLKWSPLTQYTPKGFNIYRSDTQNGTYVKINNLLITGTSIYSDYEVEENTVYYYKISVVSLSGNERPLSDLTAYKAWTPIETHGGFPVIPEIYNSGQSSPTLYDVDNNGTKEIFVNYRKSDNNNGIIMGYRNDGQDIFDIDNVPETVSGFADTEIAMLPNSAVGDIDGDGHAEVLSIGRYNNPPKGWLYVYKTVDEDNDSKPDPFWDTEYLDTGYRVYRNPVLYDINNDGFLEIIIANENQKIQVYDKDKNLMDGWDSVQISGGDYSLGDIAVADIDNDGMAEIAFGLLNSNGTKGGIYIFNHDGTPFTVNPFHEFANNERADGGITFADIDNDGQLELLATTRVSTSQGKIYAFNLDDGTFVNTTKWNGNIGFALNSDDDAQHILPRISVGDLNNDGNLEIAFGSKNILFVLKTDGTHLFTKSISDAKDTAPILADIDGGDDVEVIINSGGKINAYKSDGTECVGWRLQSENGSPFVGSPSVDDIDGDGLNEIVISTEDCATYVWDTTGSKDRIEWGSYRADSYNTGTYKHGCLGEIDIYVGDNLNDIGIEPNPTDQNMWSSPNIWVRNENDGGLEHQNPEYNGNGDPNYINVRIVNRGCDPTTGTETLTINWAKGNTSLSYPDYWIETTINDDGFPLGKELDPVTIPVIQPGEETIVTIPWVVPNPDNYTEGPGGDNPWHFCLLATILADDDPLTSPYTSNPNIMVRENNNQAWRNVTVVDLVPGRPIGGSVAVTNHSASSNSYDLLFNADDRETGKLIFEEAEVSIVLDSLLYNAWVTGGRQLSSGIHQNASSLNNPVFYITSDNAKLKNLVLAGNQMGLMALKFNMLTKELTSKPVYNYFVTQIDNTSNEIIGGETYEIRKPPRKAFYAEADDITADKNETVTLMAEDIDESAVYNWYDEEDNLIYSGPELTVIADIARTYKLEIIADADGYKDYKDVEIELNPNTLNGIVPNPANSVMTVDYNLNGPTSAYLSVLGYVGNDTGVERNYILDTESSNKTIDISGYAIGFYIVRLICDGEVVGTLNLIKQ